MPSAAPEGCETADAESDDGEAGGGAAVADAPVLESDDPGGAELEADELDGAELAGDELDGVIAELVEFVGATVVVGTGRPCRCQADW